MQIVGEEVAGEPPSGARVLTVRPDSPAAAAGLAVGDIVVRYDGRAVESNRDLQFLVADTAPGTEVALGVVRGGRPRELRVGIVEWNEQAAAAPAATGARWLGLEVASLDGPDPRVERLRQALGIVAASGVMVVAVQEGSSAAENGIRPGDVLVSIQEHELTDFAAWEQARNQLAGRREPLTVLVRTGTSERYVSLAAAPDGVEN